MGVREGLLADRPASAGGIPEGVEAVAPSNEEELSEILAFATATGRAVAVWGGGTHRNIGNAAAPDLVVSTEGLTGITEWEADDLTVVVGAGTRVADLEDELATGGQSAVLAEQPGEGTVGGAVATATSGYRRLRHGPIRDRMLEVRAVTGDGRIVKGGGRVVKNVTGYDLPRLYTGSLASLGVITSVCFKLWPLTEATATVKVGHPSAAEAVHRPLAVLETRGGGLTVLLAGTSSEVEDQIRRLGGEASEGLHYPEPVSGGNVWSLRVRPRDLAIGLGRIPAGQPYVAQHGVGEATFAADESGAHELRQWAESRGGRVVRLQGVTDLDPWGTPPAGLELQRRVVAAFDPARVLEPGRLPGGI